MSGFWGAETEAVRQQAEVCTGAAGAMEALMRSCGTLVSSVEWIGADAEAFRERWSSEVESRLQQVLEMLRADAEELRRHGDEQDEASSDDGGGPGIIDLPIPALPGFPSLPGLPGLPSLPLPLPHVELPDPGDIWGPLQAPIPTIPLPDVELPDPGDVWGPIESPIPLPQPLPQPLPLPAPLPDIEPLPAPLPRPGIIDF